MCEPMTIMAVSAGIGAATGAIGAYQETKAANAAADYNASLLQRNAEISDMKAEDANRRGRVAQNQQRQKVKSLIGSQRASFGASGVVVDSGSTLDITQDTQKYGELDAQTIRRNASMEAWGLTEEAKSQRSQSYNLLAQKRSPGAAVAQSLLTSASSFGSSYAMGQMRAG